MDLKKMETIKFADFKELFRCTVNEEESAKKLQYIQS